MSWPLNATWSGQAQAVFSEQYKNYLQGGQHWAPQHPARAWEYGLALKALGEVNVQGSNLLALDVGGAGSPLAWLVAEQSGIPMQIIDPEFNGMTLSKAYETPLLGKADFIACISVIEHVEQEDVFLTDLVNLLAPGGVLFLTTDYDPTSAPEDTFMFHWMRKRIYRYDTLYSLTPHNQSVKYRLCNLGMKIFGMSADAPNSETIPGLGYSFASLCMRKDQ